MLALPQAERVGPPECPLFMRWTLLAPRVRGSVPFKLLLHHFMPERQDADTPHDHPRPFVTLVLRGGYDDLVPCPKCEGRATDWLEVGGGFDAEWVEVRCRRCRGRGIILGDRLNAPTLRVRGAGYAHMTRTDERGAWTLVLMGPVQRAWGFWRDGRWWAFREFEQVFGFAWRCAPPDDDVG